MSRLPKDLVVIKEPVPMIEALNHPTYFVHYIRVSNNNDLEELLKGKQVDDLEASHVLLKVESVRSMRSVDEAVQVAKATLADAGSEPRRADFAANTPIYHASPGQPLLPV